MTLNERSTYVYQGNTNYKYDVVHINREFATQLSDLEPQVVRLPLP